MTTEILTYLQRAECIAADALTEYQARKISHAQAVERFEYALGKVDFYNAEIMKVIKGAASCG